MRKCSCSKRAFCLSLKGNSYDRRLETRLLAFFFCLWPSEQTDSVAACGTQAPRLRKTNSNSYADSHWQPYPRRAAPLGPYQPVARRPHQHHTAHPPEAFQQAIHRHAAAPRHLPSPRRRPVPHLLRRAHRPRPIWPRVHIGHLADGIMGVLLHLENKSAILLQ